MTFPKLDPTQIITAWTAVIAVVSLANKYILGPFAPNIARLISAIISIPTGHIANLIEDLQQLWKDISNPPPPPAGPNGSGGSTPKPPPPPMTARWKIGLATLLGFNIGGAIVAIDGCSFFKQPGVPEHIGELVACIIANFSSWQSLIANCSQWPLAQIEAEIQALLADPKFRAEHPDAIDPLTIRLGEVRAQMAAGGK